MSNTKMKKSGFSLAEALITLLIVCLITLASIPVITKKTRVKKDANAKGVYACYWNGDTLISKYIINGQVVNGSDSIFDEQTQRHGCIFNPPAGASNFVVTVVGGGGGGAHGEAKKENFQQIGEGTGIFTIPADGLYKILLIASGGAGGHTSGGEIGKRYNMSSPPATSGSPGAVIYTKNYIKLLKDAKLYYAISDQGRAREENDDAAEHGGNAGLKYSLGAATDNPLFEFHAQGGGGGASMNYEGNDRAHFYQCRNASGYICEVPYFKGTNEKITSDDDIDKLEEGIAVTKVINGTTYTFDSIDDIEYRECSTEAEKNSYETHGGNIKRSADQCTIDENGNYGRFKRNRKNKSGASDYLRSAHSGGGKITLTQGFSEKDFSLNIEKRPNTYILGTKVQDGGVARAYEYEATGAYKYELVNNVYKKTTLATPFSTNSYELQRNKKRAFWNSALTIDLLKTYNLWPLIDLDHPYGSGGYGSGGDVRNHNSPKGDGGAGVFSIIWSGSFGGKGGKAGNVTQTPFAMLPQRTLCFPGKGGKGSTLQNDNTWSIPQPGEVSFLKNYPEVAGGAGAVSINQDDSSTYNQYLAGSVASGGNGELANINPIIKPVGGAGGYTTSDTEGLNNGYIDNSKNYNGLTRPLFKNNAEITFFTGLLGAGAGGGGGTAATSENSNDIVQGNGADGSSGIIFIQW